MDELFYIVHLCGEKRDERAYAPLCRLIGEGEEAIEFLGDGVTETLSGVLINVFDGDPAPLKRAIESEDGDEFARALGARGARLSRARKQRSQRRRNARLPRRLRREMKPRGDSYIWAAWATTAANLGYDDLRLDVATLSKQGFIDEFELSLVEFDEQARLAREDGRALPVSKPTALARLTTRSKRSPSWASDEDDEWEDEALDAVTTASRRRGQPVPRRRPQRSMSVRQRQEIQEVLSGGI